MKLALRGPEGVAVKLGVVVILGLMLGSGAFALPFSIPFIGRSSAPAPAPAPAPPPAAGARRPLSQGV